MNTQTNQKNHKETRTEMIVSAYQKVLYWSVIVFQLIFFIGAALIVAFITLSLFNDLDLMHDLFRHIDNDTFYGLQFYGITFIFMSIFYDIVILVVLLISNKKNVQIPNSIPKNHCDVCYKTCGNLTKVTINNEEVHVCESCYKDLLKNYNQYQQ